jgi:hypothetical protein
MNEDKKDEGILTTVQTTVVEIAEVGVDVAKSGLEGAKQIAVAGAASVGDAVTSVTTKAKRALSGRKTAARTRSKPKKRSVKPAPPPKRAAKKVTVKKAKANTKASKRSAAKLAAKRKSIRQAKRGRAQGKHRA